MGAIQQVLAAAAESGGGSESHRYWRFTSLTVPGDYLEISELQLLVGASVYSAGVTPTFSDSAGGDGAGALTDGLLNTRNFWTQAVAQGGGFYIQFDLGVARGVNGVKQGGFDTSTRYMSGFSLQYSDDASSWTTLGSKSGLTYPGNNTLSSVYSFP